MPASQFPQLDFDDGSKFNGGGALKRPRLMFPKSEAPAATSLSQTIMATQNGEQSVKVESDNSSPNVEARDPYFTYSEEKTLQHVR